MASQVLIDALVRYGEPDEHPEGGPCRDCAWCAQGCFDEAEGSALRDELTAEYGICHEDDEHPYLVPLDQWHPWDECWTEAV